MKIRYGLLCLSGCFLLLVSTHLTKEPQEPVSAVLEAMQTELSRSMEKLKTQTVPPYFLSYEITEVQSAAVSGTFGTITTSNENRRRQLDIDLRVGGHLLDNTHPIRGGFPNFAGRFSFVEIPVENDPDALRSILWYHTDRKYKDVVEQFTKVKTNVQVKVGEEDKSGDFSAEVAEKYTERPVPIKLDRRVWEEKIRKYTVPFARQPNLYDATAAVSATGETRWHVNSEGSVIQTSQAYYRLFISAMTKAEDGMELPRYESFFAFTPDGLPDDAQILKTVEKMIQDLQSLRTAPVVDPYTGPAILSGRASGVFFHEVFGHRIEGHRQRRAEEGQTFKKKLNEVIVPEAFSVYFDPTVSRAGKNDLVGSYRFDNEGVKARRVTVIEKGIFKGFLMSRTPIEGFPKSNGHGRKQPGLAPVARQSNLLVEVSQKVPRSDLKKRLIEQLQRENRPFGLYFEDIQGGFTITGRTIPNAFNVLPILVYRIYPNGREELVRGVDLIGTPLTTFSKLLSADDDEEVFNGICGAESGGVPVSAVSPGILISQIEVQKKDKSQERLPILPSPVSETR